MFFGLSILDLAVIVAYFSLILVVGFWASTQVKNDEDYFVGGRSFGKSLLTMHWLCTGTHSEQAVQVAGATARSGLGGIWFQWMWLFSTPFYWFIAPMIRRLRLITTGDFYRVRYGVSAEKAYVAVALFYLIVSIAMLLRGAAAAINGATGNQLATEQTVIILAVLFSSYVVAGGLISAAFTDYIQGLMIITLSILLVPFGLSLVGGLEGLHDKLGPEKMSMLASPSAKEGSPLFVAVMSLIGFVGIVAQPHVMTANGAGKTENESRIGMCYGNFIKRLLTMAWAFTGLIAIAHFPEALEGVPTSELKHRSEELFGLAIRTFLGEGWRGLMIACIVAGVTSAETNLVVGSGLISRNLLGDFWKDEKDNRRLWGGRIASALVLIISLVFASTAESVSDLLTLSLNSIALMGPGVWLGVTWRRANLVSFWSGLIVAITLQILMARPSLGLVAYLTPKGYHPEMIPPLVTVISQMGTMILVGLFTPPAPREKLDAFYSRLLTPVGKEPEVARKIEHETDDAIGLHGQLFDYGKASRFGYASLRRFGIELPIFTWWDLAGFLFAWGLVFGLIGLLYFLSNLGGA